MVMTVTGEVDVKSLGYVQAHEHIFLDGYEVSLIVDLMLDDPEVAVQELQLFQAVGGRTILEMTPHGLNPDPEGLARVARETGLNIIASTGIYWERFHPAWVKERSTMQLVDLFLKELTEGIAGTNVRAGIIAEIGSNHRQVSPIEERVFRAAARAHRESGVPIYTHAPFGWVGLQQVEILRSEGVSMDRVVIGHVDTVSQFEYARRLAPTGVYMGFDTVGRKDCGGDEMRADRILELVRMGYGDRIVLASDVCRRGHLRQNGGMGYDHVIRHFLPLLRSRGVSEEQIDQFMVENPARLWA